MLAEVISQVGCILLVVLIRILATKLKWNLPKAIKFSELREEEGTKEPETLAK